MKKVLKITESQYKSLLLSEQGDTKFDIQQNQKNREPLKNKKQNDETGFKMDYKKLKNNPTPEYIATVLKNSEGFFGDNEAWAQAAFEAIKDRRVYNEVSSLLGDDAYNFVKGFMDTDEEYHTKGKTIDGEFRRISPPTYHNICNNGMGVKSKSSKFGGPLTIPNHSENCVSCDTKINQYCKSRGELATIVTEKGSYWDDYFGLKEQKEHPMYGGHWDNELYSYCVCRSGEAKTLNTTNNSSAVFFVGEGPSIKQGYDVSPQELENRRKIFLRHRKKEKEYNIDNSSIYEAFDCSEYRKSGDYWRYTQCVTDNLSMAVSIVPGPGTAISAILDFANGFSYLAHALFGEHDKDSSVSGDLVMAAISFASVMPGFGEARGIIKLTTPKTTKAASNIVQELHKMDGLKNIDSIDKVVSKHTKGFTEKQKNNVGKVINNLKNIDVSSLEKQAQIFDDIVKTYEKDGIKRHTINKLMKDPNFIKILNKYDNDINKALKSKEFKEMLINIGVQFGFGGGISKYQTYSNEVKKEVKNRNFIIEKERSLIEAIELALALADGPFGQNIDKSLIPKDYVVDFLSKEYDKNKSNFDNDDKIKGVWDRLPNNIKNENIMKNTKIKITETQYNRLFNEQTALNKAKSKTEEIKRGTPKYRNVKLLLKTAISGYNTQPQYDIKTREFKDSKGFWRFEFYDTAYDGKEIKFQIIDNDGYKTAGYVNINVGDTQFGWGSYNDAKSNALWMRVLNLFGKSQNYETTIMKAFADFKNDYNSFTPIGKQITRLNKLYDDIKDLNIPKDITEPKLEEIKNLINQTNDCKVYTNAKHIKDIFNKFNIKSNSFDDTLFGEDPKKKPTYEIRGILLKKMKECGMI